MKKEKKKQIRKYIIILVGIILGGMILIIPISNQQQEEIWFYSWLKDSQRKEKNENTYLLNLSDKKLDFEVINLWDTVSPQTIMKEKVAPGTQGEFNLILQAKETVNYQLKINSLSNKPQNLQFQEKTTGKTVNQLEELESVLSGTLEKQKSETYSIHWIWKYETNQEKDKQDTKDGKELEKYQFEINAMIEQIIKE